MADAGDELPEEHPQMAGEIEGAEAVEAAEGEWAEGTEEHTEEHGEMHEDHMEEVPMEEATAEAAGDAGEGEAGEIEHEEHEGGTSWWTGADGEGEAAETAEAGEAAEEAHVEGHEGEAHEATGAEAMEVEPNPDDPMAPVHIDVGWEAAAWLQEDDGRRLRKLERLSGGEAEVSEEGMLKLMPLSQLAPPGGGGTGHSWCDLCARLLIALRTGEEVELTPAILELAEVGADNEGLGTCILEVPGQVEKKAISGKDGAKLLDLCDTSDVLAVFTWAKEVQADAEPLSVKVGDVLEGKYGDSYFEVEVIDAPEGGDVKVKWAFDGSESELPVSDLQKKAGAESPIKAGDKVEAKYGDKWYDAEVISNEGKIKVKWGFDGSEADLEATDVQRKADAEAGAGETEAEAFTEVVVADLKEGDKVQAKYEDSFHDAEVVQAASEDGKVKIKWGFDGSEAEVTGQELRAKVEPPPPPPTKLLVLGQRRPRMALEVKVLNRIEGKLPGHVASLGKTSVEGGSVGLTVMELKPGGDGTLGKFIGKQGATKLRIERICGSTLEYMGKESDTKHAFFVGTVEERQKTQALMELLQSAVDFRVKATEMPPAIKDICSVLLVPGHASAAVTGTLELAPLQDSTDTMIFALAKPNTIVPVQKKEFAMDQVVECKFKGEWLEAKILEISSWTADSDDEDETDGRTLKVKFLADGTEATVLAFNVREKLTGQEATERDQELQRQQQRELFVVGSDPEKRREAQLRLAAMLEAKSPGAFSGEQMMDGERLAVTSMSIGSAKLEEDFLKRLGVASNCEILLEGQTAYFASGSSFECARAESFLKPFLLEEADAKADANKVDEIDGINYILIEREKQKNLPARVLNDVADKFGVVAFFDDGSTLAGVEDNVRVNVICWDVEKQTAALDQLKELQDVEPPPEETWESDNKWNEEQKEEGQDEWKKDEWNQDDGKSNDWKKDEWKKDEWKKDDWKKDDAKNNDWKKDDGKNDWKKDDWKKDDWNKKDDWKKDEWKKEEDWKGNDKKRKWEEEDKNAWGSEKKSKNDWADDKGGWGKEKAWDKSGGGGGGGGGGGWNQEKSWEKDKSAGGGKWDKSDNQSWKKDSGSDWKKDSGSDWKKDGGSDWKKDSGSDWKKDSGSDWKKDSGSDWKKDSGSDWKKDSGSDWKKDSGSDWKDDKKSWDQGKKWGQDQQDNSWKGGGGGKDDWGKKNDWNSNQSNQSNDSWGQKKQEKQDWGQKSQKSETWEDKKGAWGQSNTSTKSWASADNGAKAWGQNNQNSQNNQNKRQWPQENQDDAKRWRTDAAPSSAPRPGASISRTAPWRGAQNSKAYETVPETPKEILDSLPGGYPDSIDDWSKIQKKVWPNADPIPKGWIRVWSKRHDCEYYLRLEDNYATFEYGEVK